MLYPQRISLSCLVILILSATSVSSGQESKLAEAPADDDLFEQKIQPVLVAKCYECHSQQSANLEGGLRLDTPEGCRLGGDSGPAVVPGNPDQSILFQAITAGDDAMPPGQPLPPEVIDDFRSWILSGAPDSRPPGEASPIRDPDYSQLRQHWAFQSACDHPVPEVTDADWPRTTIDRFILRRLQRSGLSPAPPATSEILLRRVYFDLVGLPPPPEAIANFVADPSDQAYRRVVDQLLASPRYGERWAQHWLDVVRYAETEGFEYDRTLPDIWRYRDYVIASLNDDLPYDQFLTQQLAGDELDPDDPLMRIAAGFHRLGAVRRNAGNQKVASSRNEVLTERTDIIGSAMLGLTIGCARCHDHKFDPISQTDYYRLQAFVAATQEDDISLLDPVEQSGRMSKRKKLEKQIAELKEKLTDLTGPPEQRVRDRIEQLQQRLPPAGPNLCSVKNDLENLTPIRLLRRGNPDLPGAPVGMRLPGVLVPDNEPVLPPDSDNPRTRLASRLTDPQHPLTARVIVNRIWQQHFGTGLVSTPNDFGKNGSPPTHPELLDHLTVRFVSDGWRLKSLHRRIVTSSVYRQSSRPRQATTARQIDPDNRLLWAFPRRRLSGEEIRDAMLAVSGQLNSQMNGQSVILPVEQELVDQLYKPTQWIVSESRAQHGRRSIYLFAKRNLRLPFMEVFDQPTAQTSCAAREQSTHARQALELLNGRLANELAVALAHRLERDAGDDPDQWVELAYRLTTARRPSPRELELARRFIEEVGCREFALAMFNINPFLYVD